MDICERVETKRVEVKLKLLAFALNKHEIAKGHETESEALERTPPSCVAIMLTLPLLPGNIVMLEGTYNEKSNGEFTFTEFETFPLPELDVELFDVFPLLVGGLVAFVDVDALLDELLVEPYGIIVLTLDLEMVNVSRKTLEELRNSSVKV